MSHTRCGTRVYFLIFFFSLPFPSCFSQTPKSRRGLVLPAAPPFRYKLFRLLSHARTHALINTRDRVRSVARAALSYFKKKKKNYKRKTEFFSRFRETPSPPPPPRVNKTVRSSTAGTSLAPILTGDVYREPPTTPGQRVRARTVVVADQHLPGHGFGGRLQRFGARARRRYVNRS